MLAYTVITLHIHIFFDMNNNLEAMPVFLCLLEDYALRSYRREAMRRKLTHNNQSCVMCLVPQARNRSNCTEYL